MIFPHKASRPGGKKSDPAPTGKTKETAAPAPEPPETAQTAETPEYRENAEHPENREHPGPRTAETAAPGETGTAPDSAPDWSQLREPVGEEKAPRRKFPFWAVGCALVIALGMAAPPAMFALTDTAFFSNREQTGGGYQSLTPKGSDYYLVRKLHERRDANYASNMEGDNGQGGFYYQSYDSTGSLPLDYTLSPKMYQVFDEYTSLGIVDYAWVDSFYDDMAAAGIEPEMSLSGSSDTLGFLSIACDVNGSRHLGITMEAHTGKVVELFFRVTDPGLAYAPDVQQVLDQWIALNDLEGLGDWVVPTGTCWENVGLYSARGEVIALCWYEGLGDTAIFWLDLQPCTPEMLAAGTFAPTGENSALTDDLLDRDTLKQPAGGNQEIYSTGEAGYYIRTRFDGSGQVRRLDYAAGTDRCVCQKPGCTHDNADCPAYLGPEELLYTSPKLFAAEGSVYLISSGNQGVYSTEAAINILMQNGLDPTEENIRDILRVGIDRISADGLTREAVADLPVVHSNWYCVGVDGTKAYFARSLIYQDSEEPADNYLVCDVTTGQITDSPARFFRYEEVLGCYGGCLVVRRTVDPMDILHYWSQALGTAGESTSLACYELVDPATGARRGLYTEDYYELFPQYFRLLSARDKLVSVGLTPDGGGWVRITDLRTGEQEVNALPDLLLEWMLAGQYEWNYWAAPDCGLPWLQFWGAGEVFFYDPSTGELFQSALLGDCVVRALTGDGRVVAENQLTPDESAYLIGPADALETSPEAFQPLRWDDAS